MPQSDTQLEAILTAQLTASERAQGVAYLSSATVAKGTTLKLPHITIDVPWDALLAFVDGQPTANWGHACRYVVINRDTGETLSRDARFPPFQAGRGAGWRIVYRAAQVPDRALLIRN